VIYILFIIQNVFSPTVAY